MLIYNTSFHLDSENLIPPFLTFMKTVYLPSLERSPHVTQTRFVRLLHDLGDGQIGYAVMVDVPGGAAAIGRWRKEEGDALLARLHQLFGTRVVAFSTAMREVDL